jgi:hypothetical protein
MNYRYGVVFTECNDYMRKVDLAWLTFLDAREQDALEIDFDDKGRLFLNDDVHATRVDRLATLMRENDVDISIVSTRTWKPLPDVPETFE